MIPVANLVMVGAGALCVGGAVISRKRIAIAAAAIMFVAMLDLAFFGQIAALVWAAALLVAGLLLGLELRLGEKDAANEPEAHVAGSAVAEAAAEGPATRADRWGRAAMTSAVLAYPMMAWLVLGHAPMTGPTSVVGHAGHSAASPVLLLPLVLAWGLAAVLLALCAASAQHRKVHAAIEAGAMAIMILAMLAMTH